MKRLLNIAWVGLLVSLNEKLVGQCEEYTGAYAEIDFEDYVFNGQENIGWARIGEPVKLKSVFYGGNDYRMVFVGDTQNYIFQIRILDRRGKVLWDNTQNNMVTRLDFTVERTRTLIIEVTATKNSGATTYGKTGDEGDLTIAEGTCVGIFIGSRPTYKAGFKTTMSEKIVKEKIKRKYGK